MKKILARLISIAVSITFSINTCCYGLSLPTASQNNKLALQVLSKPQPMTAQFARFQQALFSDTKLLISVRTIGEYLLGNPGKDIFPLPPKHMESVIQSELGESLAGIDISQITLRNGVVAIPYTRDSRGYIIQVVLKNSLSARDLEGCEWKGVSSAYTVKIRPQVRINLIGFGSPQHYSTWNNLSLETLAGDLRGYFGQEVDVNMSCTNQIDELEKLVEDVCQAPQPHILGISVQPGSLELVQKFVTELKRKKTFDSDKTLIIFGNQIPTYFPDKILEICPDGIAVRGEAEFSLRGLVKFIKGEKQLADIPNLVYRDKISGNIVRTHLETPDLASLEYPPSSDTYVDIIRRGGNVQVQASRGCPWGGCIYCTRTSFRRSGLVLHKGSTYSWQGFSVDRVLKILEDVISRGISEVEFSDDEFLGGRTDECIDRLNAIADGIERLSQKYNIKFTFRIFSRPDLIYKDKDPDNKNEAMRQLLLRLKEVGLVKVFMGIEAGNPTQLKRYRRGLKFEEVTMALEILRNLGIGIDIGFIIFDPELTIEELLENVKFFRENQLMSYNQWPFRPLVVNEGSKIVKKLREKNLAGEPDAGFMRYEYTFENEHIARIAKIVDEISAKTRTIFYALKVKSKKYFDPNKKDDKTTLAQAYIEENGYIYLDLMEELGLNIRTASEEKIEEIMDSADQQAMDLAKRVAVDIVNGRISDEDGYLTRELDKIGIPVVVQYSSVSKAGIVSPKVPTLHSVLEQFSKYSGLPVTTEGIEEPQTEGRAPSEIWSTAFSLLRFDEDVYRRVERIGENEEQTTGKLAFENAGEDTDIDRFSIYDKNNYTGMVRTGEEMQQVLVDPSAQTTPEAYFIYRGVFRNKKAIQKAFYDNKIRYDIAVFPPALWGKEMARTKGHYHSPVEIPEIFQVLSGEAIYLMQKCNSKGEVVDAIMVKAKPGDIVIMLPGYGHVITNTSTTKPLVMANWLTWHQKSSYGSFEKNKGAVYYATLEENDDIVMRPNINYAKIPELRQMDPADSIPAFGLKKGESIYNLVESNKFAEYVRFLTKPEKYAAELIPEKTLQPTKNPLPVISFERELDRPEINENLDNLEANGIVAAIIILARKAKRMNQKLVIPIETDWIPGYLEERSFQSNAISNLIREIESISEVLRSMGLDNVELVHKGRRESLDEWAARIKDALTNPNDYSNVVVLASMETVNFLDVNKLQGVSKAKRPFLAGINSSKLKTYYEEHDIALTSDQLYIQIMEILLITLELAVGKTAPDLSIIISYDKQNRIAIFLPDADQADYDKLIERYRRKAKALQSA